MNIEELYGIYLRCGQVTTDSRRCPEGSLFFALRGATFDGNAYAMQALRAGCARAVVDDAEAAGQDGRLILVDDVLSTLQQLAAHHRRTWGGPVLQVTGTNGKTTTKELLHAVLSRGRRVLCTEGNLNNHIGVPLTLLRIRAGEHDMAVVETGANHPGEIAALCRMVQADWGIVTNVGRAHLEGFGGFEGVKRTKGELYDDLRRRGGRVLVNGEDDVLVQMLLSRGFILGRDALPYVEARVTAAAPFLAIEWRDGASQSWHSVGTALVGAYNLGNLRAAITAGLCFGIAPAEIDEALASYRPTNSRSELRQAGSNRLIVDAYNANPSSMEAALANFAALGADGHKMVILGDMRELGEESLEEHRRVVRQLQKMSLERTWLVGEEFGKVAPAGMCVFSDVDAVKAALRKDIPRHATILVKGSNGTKLWQLPDFIASL